MQEKLPNTPFEELPKLMEPPSFLSAHGVTIIVCTMMACFAYFAYLTNNWFGVCIDLAVIALNIGLSFFRWKMQRHMRQSYMRQSYKTLKTLQGIIETPRMQEIGDSVIFTMVFPSPELLAKLEKIRHGH